MKIFNLLFRQYHKASRQLPLKGFYQHDCVIALALT